MEQETRVDQGNLPLLHHGAGLGLLGVVGIYAAIVPGSWRSILNFLIAPVAFASLVGWLLLQVVLQREWMHYWVIETDNHLVACAKLQCHPAYSVLFDLYVATEWRGRGLGSHLVRHLSQQATKPLYLACLPARLPFYRRLGFVPVVGKKLPPLLQYDLGIPTRPGIIPLMLT
jgi:N-acetylglutamate synthase-like GNAT family acetyltransferase